MKKLDKQVYCTYNKSRKEGSPEVKYSILDGKFIDKSKNGYYI